MGKAKTDNQLVNGSSRKVGKVLVVEDEQSLLFLLQQIIEEQGHDVMLAENGQHALKIIEQYQPDLVISDVMMPIMDGYQLLHKIKTNPLWQKIKVVLISAAPINRNTTPRADVYLSKPYDLTTIEDLLASLSTAGR